MLPIVALNNPWHNISLSERAGLQGGKSDGQQAALTVTRKKSHFMAQIRGFDWLSYLSLSANTVVNKILLANENAPFILLYFTKFQPKNWTTQPRSL